MRRPTARNSSIFAKVYFRSPFTPEKMIETEQAKKELAIRTSDLGSQLQSAAKENEKLRASLREQEKAHKSSLQQIEHDVKNMQAQELCTILFLYETGIDIQELKEETKAAKSVGAKLKECNRRLAQMAKDLEKQRDENKKLTSENERLEQEMDVMRYQTTGDNAPEVLKKSVRDFSSKAQTLEGELSELRARAKKLEEGKADCELMLHDVQESIKNLCNMVEGRKGEFAIGTFKL